MAFEKNQVVSFNYKVQSEKGEVIDESKPGQPLSFLAGNGHVLPKVEETLNGMLLNAKKTITLEPEDAYGLFSEEFIRPAARDSFPEDLELKEGMEFMANLEDGSTKPFIIKEINDDQITCDFNHPLAGYTLVFDLELIEVRDAAPEEIEHGHAHGPGGHAHH